MLYLILNSIRLHSYHFVLQVMRKLNNVNIGDLNQVFPVKGLTSSEHFHLFLLGLSVVET